MRCFLFIGLFVVLSLSCQKRQSMPKTWASFVVAYWEDGSNSKVSRSTTITDPTDLVCKISPTLSSAGVSGKMYFFQLIQDQVSGVEFSVDAAKFSSHEIPINTTIFGPADCFVFDDLSLLAQGEDSTTFNLIITRNSGGTMDGDFGFHFDMGHANYEIKLGHFANLPIQSN